MTTFALIHGGQHGGWCWAAVQRELASRGFDSVAPDLPIDDDTAGSRAWAQTVKDSLAGKTGPVVAVAHSMGGMALPVLATMTPLRRMVFLSAVVPQLAMPFANYLATTDGRDAVSMSMIEAAPGEEERGGITWKNARASYYPDCDEAEARQAWNRLRHNSFTVFTEAPVVHRWPDVAATSIVMRDDVCLNPIWQRRMAERIGADVVELPGGHSPFLFAPAMVADALAACA